VFKSPVARTARRLQPNWTATDCNWTFSCSPVAVAIDTIFGRLVTVGGLVFIKSKKSTSKIVRTQKNRIQVLAKLLCLAVVHVRNLNHIPLLIAPSPLRSRWLSPLPPCPCAPSTQPILSAFDNNLFNVPPSSAPSGFSFPTLNSPSRNK